jgi:type VI protein secretion system component VasF
MPDSPNDIDRAAIEEAARRTAEQTALRKVRRELDQIAAGEARQRRVIRIIALVGVAAILCLVLVVWFAFFSARDPLYGTPIKIPSSAPKKG